MCNLYTYKLSRDEIRGLLEHYITTEPNGVIEPIHDKAMPVMLMTAEDIDIWLNGTLEQVLKLQKPQTDDALTIVPYDEKKAA
jgi:putative SOS response-associated peptidase YedK